jgi:subtilisin family serine protease
MLKIVSLLALVAAAAAVAPIHKGDGTAADNAWIVVFHKESTQEARDAHMSSIKGLTESDQISEVTREYSFNKFFGYAATLSPEMLTKVAADDKTVEFIESDQIMKANLPVQKVPAPVDMRTGLPLNTTSKKACAVQREATWGLVRTGERDIRLDGLFNHDDEGGKDIDAYIIDTGIYLEHVEFEGRARWGIDTVNRVSPETDRNGHGTHVAGTVMSKSYGVSKQANAVAVQVLGASGSGSTAGVIEGVEYVCADHREKGNKCVANMSLGGGFSLAMNRAVEEAIGCGCQFAVAAGNENNNACLSSPASAEDCVTVSSSDNNDRRSYFSNYGSCSDIFAPGSSITSTWIGSEYAINTISGTSMAAPHIAGVMCNILKDRPTLYPADVKAVLLESGTTGKITDVVGTPNVLGYTQC